MAKRRESAARGVCIFRPSRPASANAAKVAAGASKLPSTDHARGQSTGFDARVGLGIRARLRVDANAAEAATPATTSLARYGRRRRVRGRAARLRINAWRGSGAAVPAVHTRRVAGLAGNGVSVQRDDEVDVVGTIRCTASTAGEKHARRAKLDRCAFQENAAARATSVDRAAAGGRLLIVAFASVGIDQPRERELSACAELNGTAARRGVFWFLV